MMDSLTGSNLSSMNRTSGPDPAGGSLTGCCAAGAGACGSGRDVAGGRCGVACACARAGAATRSAVEKTKATSFVMGRTVGASKRPKPVDLIVKGAADTAPYGVQTFEDRRRPAATGSPAGR